MKKTARILSLFLALALCFSLVPAALASEEPVSDDPVIAGFEGISELHADPNAAADNDALFHAYLETQLYGAPVSDIDAPALDGGMSGDRLEGLDKTVYDLLKSFIQSAAAGNIDTAVCTFTLKDLGIKDTWLPSEFGYDGFTGDNIKDAQTRFFEAAAPDSEKIIKCLLADLPYDLYWFDKTTGWGCTSSSKYSWRSSSVTFSYELTYYFSVSGDYLPQTYQIVTLDGSVIPISINTTLAAAASRAVETANGIVAQYAAEDDYEKLAGYKAAICSLVSYNDYAADSDNGVSYGDPWQIVSVFDGDPSTNVVCEGYAKAFQYLFELSEFQSDEIACRMVTGMMASEGDEKSHMWNIVTMDDGKNYLVDITNCDDGSIGEPDKLFLKGYASRTDPDVYTFDCGEDGFISYTYDYDTAAVYTPGELALSADAYVKPVSGDANGDGAADLFDAAFILRCLVGLEGDIGFDAARFTPYDAAKLLAK